MARSPQLGFCFPREFPPSLVIEYAERLEAGGTDQLWLIEDCFYTAGVSLAAAALARTDRLTVGLGILPAVVRNPAITAMELATLARLAPGRLIAGIGHGVQDWMEQIGARPESPVATLVDVITAIRRLLAGETVTMDRPTVTLREVRLDQAPEPVPPLLAGVHGPKSLAAAGRSADGIVLAPMYGPAAVRHAIAVAAPTGAFQVVVYSVLSMDDDRLAARRAIAPLVAETVQQGGSSGLRATPFFADLAEIVAAGDLEELVHAPDEWWIDLGAIGTPDDIGHHVDALAAAGADAVSFFPAPFVDEGRQQVDRVLAELVSRR